MGALRRKNAVWGAYVITSENHEKIAEAACAGGARILQYRAKNAERKKMLETAKTIRKITAESGTLFIVNDFIDIALLSGADGVHLGQGDIPIQDARKITAPDFLIGISTHSLLQARAAQAAGADYIGCGPLFATPTKADYQPVGTLLLQEVLRQTDIPVVGIGGINLINLKTLAQMGLKNAAMVREFQTDTCENVTAVNEILLD